MRLSDRVQTIGRHHLACHCSAGARDWDRGPREEDARAGRGPLLILQDDRHKHKRQLVGPHWHDRLSRRTGDYLPVPPRGYLTWQWVDLPNLFWEDIRDLKGVPAEGSLKVVRNENQKRKP